MNFFGLAYSQIDMQAIYVLSAPVSIPYHAPLSAG